MDDIGFILFLIVLVVLIIGFAVIFFYLSKLNRKEEYNSIDLEKTEIIEDFEKKTFHGKIVDMQCESVCIGRKFPKNVNIFTVYFECDDNSVIKIPVNEEMYSGFDIDMTGTLTLSGNVIYSFEPD